MIIRIIFILLAFAMSAWHFYDHNVCAGMWAFTAGVSGIHLAFYELLEISTD